MLTDAILNPIRSHAFEFATKSSLLTAGKITLIITRRVALAPISVAINLVDTTFGLLAQTVNITTRCVIKYLNENTIKNLNHSNYIVINFYSLINPLLETKFSDKLIPNIRSFLIHQGDYQRNAQGFFQKYLASRATDASVGACMVIVRLFVLVIGLSFLLPSILTLGESTISYVVFEGLQITGVIYDLSYILSKIINPWVGASMELPR